MRAVLLVVTCAVAGCGGGSEPAKPAIAGDLPQLEPALLAAGETSAAAAARAAQVKWAPRLDLSGADVIRTAMLAGEKPKLLAPATSEDPVLTIEDEHGSKQSMFELAPVHGKGYPELSISLTARTIGETTPPREVAPACKDPASCAYPLRRQYTIALEDDKLLQLVSRGDRLAVVSRVLKVEEERHVDVLFSVDGQVLRKTRILLKAG